MEVQIPDEVNIRSEVISAGDLPPLPGALMRLLEMIQSEASSPDELESIIRFDQALAAKILRVANSSFYGMRGNVRTLAKAMMIIGLDRVRSICIGVILLHMWSNKQSIDSAQREVLWKHAFATARIASEIAGKRPWMSSDKAYVLGLLHDIGKLAMAVTFPSGFSAIGKISGHRGIPFHYAEQEVGLSHSQIGKWVAIKWRLPKIFQRVIEFHHQPEKATDFRTETTLIHLANILANAVAYPQIVQDERTIAHCGVLMVTEEEWDEYSDRMKEISPEVDQFWNLLK